MWGKAKSKDKFTLFLVRFWVCAVCTINQSSLFYTNPWIINFIWNNKRETEKNSPSKMFLEPKINPIQSPLRRRENKWKIRAFCNKHRDVEEEDWTKYIPTFFRPDKYLLWEKPHKKQRILTIQGKTFKHHNKMSIEWNWVKFKTTHTAPTESECK